MQPRPLAAASWRNSSRNVDCWKSASRLVAVAEVLAGELDGRTRLEIAAGADVVADALDGGAERAAVGVPIGVDDQDGVAAAGFDEEAAHAQDVGGVEREVRGGIGAGRAVDVVAGVEGAAADHVFEEGVAEQVVEVVLAEAAGHAEEEALAATGLDGRHGAAPHVVAAAADVADRRAAFDADDGRDVAEATELGGHAVVEERAVREDLVVAVAVAFEERGQLRVQQRLASEEAEEVRAVALLPFADDGVERLQRQLARGGGAGDPAAAAGEVAAIGERDEEHGRGSDAARRAFLEGGHAARALPAERPGEPREDAGSGFEEHPACQGEEHGRFSRDRP